MSWTEAGDGVSCAWTGVTLSLPDVTKGQPARWGGGHGSCDGLVDSDNLVIVDFVVDSLSVEDGHIVFEPRGSTYRFEGRVTMGRWQAVRALNQ